MEPRKELVFIVEDDVFYAEMIQESLKLKGYENIEIFTSAKACIDQMYKMPFIIVLDYNLDGDNGVAVLNEVMDFTPNTHVILMSGQDEISVAVDLLKKGAFNYIKKDFQAFDELKECLMKIDDVEQLVSHENRKAEMKNLIISGLVIVAMFFAGMQILSI